MLYRRIIAVCPDIHKNINALCRQNVQFLNVQKPGGTQNNHLSVRGWRLAMRCTTGFRYAMGTEAFLSATGYRSFLRHTLSYYG